MPYQLRQSGQQRVAMQRSDKRQLLREKLIRLTNRRFVPVAATAE